MIVRPGIGFGTSPYRDGALIPVGPAVRGALRDGYRLFDLAEMYGNEREVGRELARHPRGRLRIVGKLWNTNHAPERVRAACVESLTRAGIGYFDVYLVHSPEAWAPVGSLEGLEGLGVAQREALLVPRRADGAVARSGVPLAETWGALGRLVEEGLVRAIGVSNFSPAEVCELGSPAPAVVQLADDPRDRAPGLAAHRASGAALMVHSPLSPPGLLADPRVTAVAARLGSSPAQVVLAWHAAGGKIPLVFSTSAAHRRENLAAVSRPVDPGPLGALGEP